MVVTKANNIVDVINTIDWKWLIRKQNEYLSNVWGYIAVNLYGHFLNSSTDHNYTNNYNYNYNYICIKFCLLALVAPTKSDTLSSVTTSIFILGTTIFMCFLANIWYKKRIPMLYNQVNSKLEKEKIIKRQPNSKC